MELLDIKQVAEILKVSERTVSRLIDDLAGFKVRNQWRFKRDDVAKYIQRQQEKVARVL